MIKPLDMIIKVNCKDAEETEWVTKEIMKFQRRIKHIRNKELIRDFDYEASVVNMESRKIKTFTNQIVPREVNP